MNKLTSVGLFAGIGGLELGLERAGIKTELLCELDPAAQAILAKAFPATALIPDIRSILALPKTDVIAAGFPCQNLSLVGNNTGIFGAQSGLIQDVFRLLDGLDQGPRWLVLENVPFMLWQKKGEAMHFITTTLSEMGYMWAYRVVDTRSFGLPQRRRRVLFVASKVDDPRNVLFADDAGPLALHDDGKVACGFYWTEGRAGLGWAVNGVPTLKGGSSIGIPSAPAIWDRQSGLFGTPDILDGERLQGFSTDWTNIQIEGKRIREGHRWKLVGNAVSIPVAEWLGQRLINPGKYDPSIDEPNRSASVWPNAAWGYSHKITPVNITEYPRLDTYHGITDFLSYPKKPLSHRASTGFLKRAESGSLRFTEGFLDSLRTYIDICEKKP